MNGAESAGSGCCLVVSVHLQPTRRERRVGSCPSVRHSHTTGDGRRGGRGPDRARRRAADQNRNRNRTGRRVQTVEYGTVGPPVGSVAVVSRTGRTDSQNRLPWRPWFEVTDHGSAFYTLQAMPMVGRWFRFSTAGRAALAVASRMYRTGCIGMHADDVRPFVSLSLSICLSSLATLFA